MYRLANHLGLVGWVSNAPIGVEIHAEGEETALEEFIRCLNNDAPEAAQILHYEAQKTEPRWYSTFVIAESFVEGKKEVGISPDLVVCQECLEELFSPDNPRYRYPYITCTNCGPRYSIVLGLPYDRAQTTMNTWQLCKRCEEEYHNPLNRRFHAQPVACPECGPEYYVREGDTIVRGSHEAIRTAANYLHEGKILAIKGIGGYHLVCDAQNRASVQMLRERKFRKDKPFALMVQSLEAAQNFCELNETAIALLTSSARPIVLAPIRSEAKSGQYLPFAEIAPKNTSLGIMLPYTPLHYVLFEELRTIGASTVFVMTSANRSSEPICYRDDDALERLSGIADAFLIGERPIARRVEDSVVQTSPLGKMIIRRSRGYAPANVVSLPFREPCLALGADLKNTITLAVEKQAFTSQFIGDLEQAEAVASFRETIRDMLSLYDLTPQDVVIAHDAHPGYISTLEALALPARHHYAIQHHKAHIASVLAERQEYSRQIVGIAFDGTGWGDDGTIWGGEMFVGSIESGLERVGHFRHVPLVGGDAAARHPVQATCGFLQALQSNVDFSAAPFNFPDSYRSSVQLLHKNIRVFPSSSVGRLFDAVAALLGFTRPVTFEGQAAMWLEYLANQATTTRSYQVPLIQTGEMLEWDWQPLVADIVQDVQHRREQSAIAAGFHQALALAILESSKHLCTLYKANTLVLSGGVFQNIVLLRMITEHFRQSAPQIELWTNSLVPCNDGGISLGQAVLAMQSG